MNITTENLPTVSAFGYSFTQESVASIFGISVFAAGSFVWNELITLTRENNNIDHKILTLDELKEVREILKMFRNFDFPISLSSSEIQNICLPKFDFILKS